MLCYLKRQLHGFRLAHSSRNGQSRGTETAVQGAFAPGALYLEVAGYPHNERSLWSRQATNGLATERCRGDSMVSQTTDAPRCSPELDIGPGLAYNGSTTGSADSDSHLLECEETSVSTGANLGNGARRWCGPIPRIPVSAIETDGTLAVGW